ncbi:DUF3800 domain-containing protein [Stygiolobus caldivivus]|uniref:DUF3800 domain-containing protein n=1 Tax=Stygiolobus caldivivus TaxID=2824673 RepID=A0A8D5U7Y4_9CREN|nr:DUF3800 domain-containing protein [Stygiolobus caldivivus]BCU71014.1 hypothetical protein KN1_23110 [Stygiolobus caldivivus]
MLVFIDESGDTGISSKYFVVAGVVVRRENDILEKHRRAVNEAKVGAFHFKNDSGVIRNVFISWINKMDLKAVIYVIEKAGYVDRCRVIEKLVKVIEPKEKLILVIDSFINNKRLEATLRDKLEAKLAEYLYVPVCVKFLKNTPGLQVSDYFASASFQYYERRDESYFLLLKPKIVKTVEERENEITRNDMEK